jgi:murein L,D-transpeptidase YafK
MGKVHIVCRLSLLLLSLEALMSIASPTAFARNPYKMDSTRRSRFHEAKLKADVDSIVVVKRLRQMYVFNSRKLLKVYSISLGEQPVGAKHFKNDRKTPEGIYYITKRNPYSMAHKSLAISYPNDRDRKYARAQGRDTGGDIMIHGILNGYDDQAADFVGVDWTWGCIAVTNEEVDELYEHVRIGSPINIFP